MEVLFDKISDTFNKIQSDLSGAGYLLSIALLLIGLYVTLLELYKFYKIYQIDKWIILEKGCIITDIVPDTTYSYSTYSVLFYTDTIYQNYYRTLIGFDYTYNGTKYKGTRYSYYEPWFENKIDAQIQQDQFKVGQIKDLIINPNNPSEAYILNVSYNLYKSLFVGLILLAIGGFFTYKSLKL